MQYGTFKLPCCLAKKLELKKRTDQLVVSKFGVVNLITLVF